MSNCWRFYNTYYTEKLPHLLSFSCLGFLGCIIKSEFRLISSSNSIHLGLLSAIEVLSSQIIIACFQSLLSWVPFGLWVTSKSPGFCQTRDPCIRLWVSLSISWLDSFSEYSFFGFNCVVSKSSLGELKIFPVLEEGMSKVEMRW